MNFSFQLATDRDDADLRHLLATNAMPGRITMTFEREPNYFVGCETMGRSWQVLIGRHQPSGEVAAVLCRATQPRFVNGQIVEIGYLGQLRVAEKYRGRWVLLHGIAALRELDADGRVSTYLVAISDENRIARGILVDHPRSQFPAMREIGRIYTLGIILSKPWTTLSLFHRSRSSAQVERGSLARLGEIVAYLGHQGAHRQFFPVYEKTSLSGPATRGFQVEDLLIARQAGEIRGVLGLWDQSGYKQSVVQSYDKSLRRIRPLYNLAARAVGVQSLPAPGDHILSAYASFICVTDDDPHIFALLLGRAYRLATERGYAYLMLGLVERDPLLPTARRYPHISYHSSLYTACWQGARALNAALDDRVPYIEIAAL